MSPKCNHKRPYGTEGKEDMTPEEKGKVTSEQDAILLASKMEKGTMSPGVQL